MHFANLVLEGILVSEEYRKTCKAASIIITQSKERCATFNAYLRLYRQNCGNMIQQISAIDRENNAQALIAEEEAERAAALRKTLKRRTKRQRKNVKVVVPKSKLNPEAMPFIPSF